MVQKIIRALYRTFISTEEPHFNFSSPEELHRYLSRRKALLESIVYFFYRIHYIITNYIYNIRDNVHLLQNRCGIYDHEDIFLSTIDPLLYMLNKKKQDRWCSIPTQFFITYNFDLEDNQDFHRASNLYNFYIDELVTTFTLLKESTLRSDSLDDRESDRIENGLRIYREIFTML